MVTKCLKIAKPFPREFPLDNCLLCDAESREVYPGYMENPCASCRARLKARAEKKGAVVLLCWDGKVREKSRNTANMWLLRSSRASEVYRAYFPGGAEM